MTYALFLDDERYPPTSPPPSGFEWVILRDFAQACRYVEENGMPVFVSFDHDLGDGPTGMAFAKWLVERDMDGVSLLPATFQFFVHSQNPVGATNIRGLMEAYLSCRAVNLAGVPP